MKQFDYNKYLKNNPLLKEDALPKAVPPPPPGGPKNAPPRAATPPKTGTPPATSTSKIAQKASKFVGDNKMFVDKMKATIGTDSKILAGIMVSIANTIIRDKKLPSNPNMNKAIQYLNSTAGEKTASTPPPPPTRMKEAAMNQGAQNTLWTNRKGFTEMGGKVFAQYIDKLIPAELAGNRLPADNWNTGGMEYNIGGKYGLHIGKSNTGFTAGIIKAGSGDNISQEKEFATPEEALKYTAILYKNNQKDILPKGNNVFK